MPVEPNLYDDEKLAAIRKDQVDPIIMYFIVREDLNMTPGKLAAQCAHGAQMLLLRYWELKRASHNIPFGGAALIKCEAVDAWLKESFRKVVLRANLKEFNQVKELENCFVVRDAGLTEVDAGTETVLVLWPMKKSLATNLKRLQAL
jgi:peptidyl-tRNA hydrolase, PTH2 family